VRLLLDENIPIELADAFVGHQTDTVTGVGWAGVKNGELLRRIAGQYEVFITMDRNLEYQQNVSALTFAVLVLLAESNRVSHLRPLIANALVALDTVRPGELHSVDARLPH